KLDDCRACRRPRVEVDPRQVAGLRTPGRSWNEIAQELNIGKGTAQRAFQTLPKNPPRPVNPATEINQLMRIKVGRQNGPHSLDFGNFRGEMCRTIPANDVG